MTVGHKQNIHPESPSHFQVVQRVADNEQAIGRHIHGSDQLLPYFKLGVRIMIIYAGDNLETVANPLLPERHIQAVVFHGRQYRLEISFPSQDIKQRRRFGMQLRLREKFVIALDELHGGEFKIFPGEIKSATQVIFLYRESEYLTVTFQVDGG